MAITRIADINVEGLAELEKFLTQFPDDLATKMLVSSLHAAAKPILEKAEENVVLQFGDSVRFTGTLEAALMKGKIRRTGLAARVDVKVRGPKAGDKVKDPHKYKPGSTGDKVPKPYGDNAFYAGFLEFGTSHMPARPFLLPAAELMAGAASTQMLKTLQKRVIAYCKKTGVTFKA